MDRDRVGRGVRVTERNAGIYPLTPSHKCDIA